MRLPESGGLLVAASLALTLAAAPAAAQSAEPWTPPRTADGQPDIQGVWTNFDPTPFEAPDEADIERLAPLARWFPGTNEPPRMPRSEPAPRREVSGFADGPGSAPRNARDLQYVFLLTDTDERGARQAVRSGLGKILLQAGMYGAAGI